MTEVIGVRFKKVGKVYYFDPCGVTAQEGENVVVETARGMECGEVAMSNREVEDSSIVQPLKKLIRKATENDLRTVEHNAQLEKEAFRICEEKILKHKLEMKLVAVEYAFDHSKILFYFSADGRIDFRELVKDLASVFRTRIELRQIGVRDEAKMIGGLGICGRPLCCTTFLDDFQPVSINMAKEQGLSLNPTKISGTCGRLMCCLKYESDTYKDLIRHAPKVDSVVDTPQGRGTVMDVSLLKGCCKVRLQSSPDTPVVFPCSECVCGARAAQEMPADPSGEAASLPDIPAAESLRTETGSRPSRQPRPSTERQGQENRQPRHDRSRQQDKPRPEREKPVEQAVHPAEQSGEAKGQGHSSHRRRRGGRGGQRRGNKQGGDRPANGGPKPPSGE